MSADAPASGLRHLTYKEVSRIYRTEMCAAFPPSELWPLLRLHSMVRKGTYEVLGYFEGGQLLGCAILGRSGSYVLLDYLFTCQGLRSRGIGTRILHLVQERFRDTDGLLAEVEAPVPGEDNTLRERRLHFYLRNQFQPLSHEAEIFSVRYRLLVWRREGAVPEQAAMRAHNALYAGLLSPRLFRRAIHIPVQPEHERRKTT